MNYFRSREQVKDLAYSSLDSYAIEAVLGQVPLTNFSESALKAVRLTRTLA